ncbi:hypothetical protein CHS0354_002768 [Potamilus streckersoni]|uniref:Neuroblastoma-amplified sequence n=1 Tax=Potamilus streckersoni TaxID=2493646 RepID=A0AAE0VZ46_9BIVA|nr:hypothetical protein CHS0354_002768 [Potamilus streckersoni]
MADTVDVESESSEENILYDLTIHADWKHDNEIFNRATSRASRNAGIFGRITSSTQRAAWTFLRILGWTGWTNSTAIPCSLPNGLVKLVNSRINWHIAVASDGKYVAILQDQQVEIRSSRDEYASVTGRATVERDLYPQWRHLVWSPDSTMLACSYSNGSVEVFDIFGAQLFIIPGEVPQSSNLPVDLSRAVASLLFTDYKPDDGWSGELLVINYHGSLTSCLVDRERGFQKRHSFVFSKDYPLGISCVIYHPGAQLLYVGGCVMTQDAPSLHAQEGLTAWRILSDMPHFKLVTDYEEDLHISQKRSFRRRLRIPQLSIWGGEQQDGVYKMSLSPDGKILAVIHTSGKFSLWAVPSFRRLKVWEHLEQPGSEELSPDFVENPQIRKHFKDLVPSKNLIDVNWWSSEAVILARCSGAVTVSSKYTLKNLLGTSPEWFEPSPQVSAVHYGGFLGLEVENKFPSKRRLAGLDADENNDDSDDDDDDVGFYSKTKEFMQQTLYFVTDSERFQPPRKKPKIVNRTYRLVSLKSTTPEELFARKINNEEYGEALALAKAYGLDSDLVYQRQWKKSPVSKAAIQDYLSKIKKRAWVLHECMERISESIDAMKELLEFGLHGTDLPALIAIGNGEDHGRFMLCDPLEGMYEDVVDEFDPEADVKREELKSQKQKELLMLVNLDNLTLEQRELCRARRKLLQYLYRLKTYEYILGGISAAAERFDSKYFEKFRSQNIVETALYQAQCSDWKALEILFTFHAADLAPHRLAILSNFPETTNPCEYKLLLPEIGEDDQVLPWPEDKWWEPDWVEMDAYRTVIEPHPPDLGAFLYEEHPELSTFRGSLTSHLVSDWYKFRVNQIESLSRQVDNALELVKLGIERRVEGLTHTLDDLVTMEMLVYDCHVEDSLTFEKLQTMADYEKLELIMAQTTQEMYSKNLHKWLIPFLKQCERRSPLSYNTLLRDYIVTKAKTDLTLPLKIFEASKINLPNPVLSSQVEVMSVALEAIYTCERDDQLSLAVEILKCLPQKGYGRETAESKKLHAQVDKLEHHHSAARILNEHGIKKTIFSIKELENNADEVEQLFIKLTRFAAKKDPPLSETQWSKLHGDIMEIQDRVFHCVSKTLCHEIFTASLLCSGKLENIKLAGKLVERTESGQMPTPTVYTFQTRVPYDRSIILILSSAQEYFNSSASLSDPCMDLARSCLNLIQDKQPQIQEEQDLIASLTILEEFDVSLLPLQVRLSKDRLQLVKQAVQNKPQTYKQPQKLLRLGHLMRIPSDEKGQRDGKVLHLVAEAALKARDFDFAFSICVELIHSVHSPAWDVCVQLAKQDGFHNIKQKVELLSFAVTFCTPDMIENVLQARALLETQLLFEKLNSTVEDSSTSRGSEPRLSSFSARAALQQTQQILSSTTRTTRAVLSTVTDAKFWHGTISQLNKPLTRQISHDRCDSNEKFMRQGCHPFYEGIIENCYSDSHSANFLHMEVEVSPEVETSENILRTAKLEEMLTEGKKSQPASEVLLQLAGSTLASDSSLGLAYLLALDQPSQAEKCFDGFPSTDISLQLAMFYYALQIFAATKPCTTTEFYNLYTHPPARVIQRVVDLVTQKLNFDWPADVMVLVDKLKYYNEMLEDYTQAKILQKLGRGIDIVRFAEDAEYKRETILGLAMSLDSKVFSICTSLAQKHDVPLWEIYMTHVEYLFTDSGLSTEEINTRLANKEILSMLKSQPSGLCQRMSTYVYPIIAGTNHAQLIYYYTLLIGCDEALEGGLNADAHVKLLKRIKPIAPDLNYKDLVLGNENPIKVISPCLTADNITPFNKLASLIPDGKGGFLHASVVNCSWAVKYFWEGNCKSASAWIHRYESCGEYIQKCLPRDVINFVDAVIFTPQAREKLETDSRIEIAKRVIKFCKQQGGKKKKQDDKSEVTWDNVMVTLQSYLAHLETLNNEVFLSMSQAGDTKIQGYAESYDLSCGLETKLQVLYIQMLLEGQSLEMIDDILTVAPLGAWTPATVTRGAMEVIVKRLRNDIDIPVYAVEMDALVTLRTIVKNVQEHVDEGGDLVKADEIPMMLRPFCSDSAVAVQPRLDVLHILEESFKLSEEDRVLITLYRTQAVVTANWTELQVTESDVLADAGKQKLFMNLLKESVNSEQYLSLCQLLTLWPPLQSMTKGPPQENPWVLVFSAMIDTRDRQTVEKITPTLQKILPVQTLPAECVKIVYFSMLSEGYILEGVKFCLVSGHQQLFDNAMQQLRQQAEIYEDEDLFNIVLKNKLVPTLVDTGYYPSLVKHVLANQDPVGLPDYLSAEAVANQLLRAGLEAEAGSLLLQTRSTHPLLQTFAGAIGTLGKWFK